MAVEIVYLVYFLETNLETILTATVRGLGYRESAATVWRLGISDYSSYRAEPQSIELQLSESILINDLGQNAEAIRHTPLTGTTSKYSTL